MALERSVYFGLVPWDGSDLKMNSSLPQQRSGGPCGRIGKLTMRFAVTMNVLLTTECRQGNSSVHHKP